MTKITNKMWYGLAILVVIAVFGVEAYDSSRDLKTKRLCLNQYKSAVFKQINGNYFCKTVNGWERLK